MSRLVPVGSPPVACYRKPTFTGRRRDTLGGAGAGNDGHRYFLASTARKASFAPERSLLISPTIEFRRLCPLVTT